VGTSFHHTFACYDTNKIIKILMADMPYEDAVEHFDFNIAGAYVGANTPVFIELPVTGDDL